MTARAATPPVGTQQAGLDTNHEQQPDFAAGPPTTSLSASAPQGVLRKISGPLRAGCNGKPRPRADATYTAQGGWLEVVDSNGKASRIPVTVSVKASFGTTACQNYLSAAQSCCEGCQHRRAPGGPP